MDRVVDDYEPVIAGLDNDISEIEADVFASRSAVGIDPSRRIFKLKREVLDFHRHAKPLLEPLQRLQAGRVPSCGLELRDYFRDVHDHLLRVVAEIENFRDLLTDALNANLAQASVRQNDDMRKISALVAIAAVPDGHRRHLRHELRAHAGAGVAVRLPGRAGASWRWSAPSSTAGSSAPAGSEPAADGDLTRGSSASARTCGHGSGPRLLRPGLGGRPRRLRRQPHRRPRGRRRLLGAPRGPSGGRPVGRDLPPPTPSSSSSPPPRGGRPPSPTSSSSGASSTSTRRSRPTGRSSRPRARAPSRSGGC